MINILLLQRNVYFNNRILQEKKSPPSGVIYLTNHLVSLNFLFDICK